MRTKQLVLSSAAFSAVLLTTGLLTAFSSPLFCEVVGIALINTDNHSAFALNLLKFPASHGAQTAQETLGLSYTFGPADMRDTEHGKRYLMEAANNGSVTGQRYLGHVYEREGKGHYTEAVKWYDKASSRGDAEAQLYGAFIRYFGVGIPVDRQGGFDLIQKSANGAVPNAQRDLGRFYELGSMGKVDEAQAAKWFEKSAKQGVANSQYHLGIALLNGAGVKADAKQGLMWLEKAAANNNWQAQLALGEIYFFRLFGKNDDDKADKYLTRAGQQGSSTAKMLRICIPLTGENDTVNRLRETETAAAKGNYGGLSLLANLHRDGFGYPRDATAANALYERAATAGDADANWYLGKNKYFGTAAAPPDPPAAATLLEKSASEGNSQAKTLLANMYLYGIGVPEDRKRSFALLTEAAKAGNPEAQYQLGSLYYSGFAGSADEKQGAQWLTAAAENGDVFAQEKLGHIQSHLGGETKEKGKQWLSKAAEQGLLSAQLALAGQYALHLTNPADLTKSYELIKAAADEGDLRAMQQQGRYLLLGIGVPKDRKHALELFKAAAARGSVDALTEIGDIYYFGSESGEPDTQEAHKWYKLAADQGDKKAAEKLKSRLKFKNEENPGS